MINDILPPVVFDVRNSYTTYNAMLGSVDLRRNVSLNYEFIITSLSNSRSLINRITGGQKVRLSVHQRHTFTNSCLNSD